MTSAYSFSVNNSPGSLTAISDAAGNLVESLSYDPWGRRRNPNDWNDYNVSSTLFDRGFTGHSLSREERNGKHLPQFGLIYPAALHCIALTGSATANFSLHSVCENQASADMNGRVYDPFLASFLSPDPFVQAPNYSQNYNRYSYAFNNPLKYTDPSGYTFKPDDWDKGFGGAISYTPMHAGYQGNIGPGSGNHWSDVYKQSWGAHYNWGSGQYFDNYGNVIGWQKAIANTLELFPDLVATILPGSNGRIAGNAGISKVWGTVEFETRFDKITKGISANSFNIYGETGVINKFIGYSINLQLVDYGNNTIGWHDVLLSEIVKFANDINELTDLTALSADILKETLATTKFGGNLAFLIAQSKPLISVANQIPIIGYGSTGLSVLSDLSLSLSGKQNWIESGMNLGVTTTAMAIGGWWGVLLQADYMAAKAYTKIICNHPEYIPSRQWGLR